MEEKQKIDESKDRIKHLENNINDLTPDNSVAIPDDLSGKYAGLFHGETFAAAIDLIRQAYEFGVQAARNESSIFIVIPAVILEKKELTGQAKLVYGAVSGLSRKIGYCYATNKYLSQTIGISERSVQRALSSLVNQKLAFVEIERKHAGTYRKIHLNYTTDCHIGDTTNVIQGIQRLSYQKKNKQNKNKQKNFLKKEQVLSQDTIPKINTPTPIVLPLRVEEKVIISPDRVKGINQIISLFRSINPSFTRLYSNQTQRKSVERLIQQHGLDKVRKMVGAAVGSFSKRYAPVICTPYELEKKLPNLISYLNREKVEDEKNKIPII